MRQEAKLTSEGLDGTTQVKTYRARRRLKISPTEWREPGQLYPEGHLVFRIDSHVHQGRVVEVNIDKDEFLAALDSHVGDPERQQRIREIVGLDPTVKPTGLHHSPRARQPTVPVAIVPPDKSADTRLGGPSSGTGKKKAVPATRRAPTKRAGTKVRRAVVGTGVITRPAGETDHPQLVPLRTLDE